MIESLHIQGLGLITDAKLTLKPGFVVVTGETGAGKTLMLDAIRLLAGAKPSTVNQQRETALDAVLDVKHPDFAHALSELGVSLEDGALYVSRTFPVDGRAKTVLQGRAVPASILSDCAETWLAIHGPHDSLRLLKATIHRPLLDRFGWNDIVDSLTQHEVAYRVWKSKSQELERIEQTRAELLRDADVMRADVQLCQSLALKPGEDTEIAQTIDRISRIDSVRNALEMAVHALAGDDVPLTAAISAARKSLEQGLPDDAQAQSLAQRLQTVGIELGEISHEISTMMTELDVDPATLDALMLRQRNIKSLLLRHGPDIEDLLVWQQDAERKLRLIDPDGTEVEALRREVDETRREAEVTAQALTSQRQSVATVLSERISQELANLALPYARVVVDIQKAHLSETGQDRIEFLFSANPGVEPASLSGVASGGELSRLMLALELVLADSHSPDVMVFDEVDAGVAGAAALSVGERLSRLSLGKQVIVVSHLPQIAAFADQHIVVNKQTDGQTTETEIAILSADQRITEISRMLAGIESSSTARAHAQELLEQADSLKAGFHVRSI